MLIKRQRCEEYINLAAVESIYTEGSTVLARYTGGENVTLGRYKNRIRTVEVFREIIKAYKTQAVEVNVSAFIV